MSWPVYKAALHVEVQGVSCLCCIPLVKTSQAASDLTAERGKGITLKWKRNYINAEVDVCRCFTPSITSGKTFKTQRVVFNFLSNLNGSELKYLKAYTNNIH